MTARAPLHYRAATTGDIARMAAIEAGGQAFPWTEGHFADSLKSGYRCTLAVVGGESEQSEVVGFAIVMLVLDEAHLLNIALAPVWQGQGLGAALLRHAMREAKAAGAQTMLLEVRPGNVRAVELYRHFGFVQIGVRKGYYPHQNGREDAWVFVRTLDSLEGVKA